MPTPIGTGTTLKVAKQHGRNAIGIELNAEYVDLIERRLLQEMQPGAHVNNGPSLNTEAA